MQVGSLVELVEDFSPRMIKEFNKRKNLYPVKSKIYTVRDLGNFAPDPRLNRITYIRVEEIVNAPTIYSNGTRVEIAFLIKKFRELQPPMEISIEEMIFERV